MGETLRATGRRKTAVANIIMKDGKGECTVNKKSAEDYFKSEKLISEVKKPLKVLDMESRYDIRLNIKGGGLSGQAEAARLAVSRSLAGISDEYRSALKKEGLLTRDARAVERKKYGLAGARKRFQFSKR